MTVKSVRLNAQIRKEIVDDLLAHRFKKECEKLAKKKRAFALKVYKDVFKGDVAKMNRLPDDWIPRVHRILVQLGPYVQALDFGTRHGRTYYENNWRSFADLAEEVEVLCRVPHGKKDAVLKVYDPEHALHTEYEELSAWEADLNERIRATKKQAEAAVGATTTAKVLAEIWPEVKPFLKKHEDKVPEKAKLPAVPRESLNAMLDLPV